MNTIFVFLHFSNQHISSQQLCLLQSILNMISSDEFFVFSDYFYQKKKRGHFRYMPLVSYKFIAVSRHCFFDWLSCLLRQSSKTDQNQKKNCIPAI